MGNWVTVWNWYLIQSPWLRKVRGRSASFRLGPKFCFHFWARVISNHNGFTLFCLFHRYPGTTFTTHVLRYQDNPDVKMIVLLGEVMIPSVPALFFDSSLTPCLPSIFTSLSFLPFSFLFSLTKTITFGFKVGGRDEYEICDALKSGRINKPLVAWCIGTCANMFTSEVGPRFLRYYISFMLLIIVSLFLWLGSIWTCRCQRT